MASDGKKPPKEPVRRLRNYTQGKWVDLGSGQVIARGEHEDSRPSPTAAMYAKNIVNRATPRKLRR